MYEFCNDTSLNKNRSFAYIVSDGELPKLAPDFNQRLSFTKDFMIWTMKERLYFVKLEDVKQSNEGFELLSFQEKILSKECGKVNLVLINFEDMFSERICDEFKVFEVSE